MTLSPSAPRRDSPTGTARSWRTPRRRNPWRERRDLLHLLELADNRLYQDVLHPGKSLLWKIPLLTLMSLLPLACLVVLEAVLNRF